MLPGGKGANQALAARRAGAEVTLHAAVGRDAFADPALAQLLAAGVALDGVRRVDAPTGVALIHVDARGENAITVVRGANAAADPALVPDASLHPGTVLLMQLEVPTEAVYALRGTGACPGRAGDAQRGAGAIIARVRSSHRSTCSSSTSTKRQPCRSPWALPRPPTTSPPMSSGATAARPSSLSGAKERSPPSTAVFTPPRRRKCRWSIQRAPATPSVGALAAALDRGASWPRALAEGIAAGALACQRSGAQPALPDAAEIAALATRVEASIDHFGDRLRLRQRQVR